MHASRAHIAAAVFTALLLLPLAAPAQMTHQDSLWQPLSFMEGTWKGTGGGEPGEGAYERSYHFIFDKKFLEVRNKSVYAPTEQNAKGEVHEDLGYISYDKVRKRFVLRQFHTEGFVNQYTLDSVSADQKRLVFVSEAIENIRPGWRAKETYELLEGDAFRETFSLAPPQGEFEPYSTVVLHRVK